MIKKLLISSAAKSQIQSFIEYLEIKGYRNPDQYCYGVIEFIHQIEQQKINLEQVDPEVIKSHYEYLLKRPNHYRGGSLSESTIHGYLFSLKLFFAYLHQLNFLAEDPMSVLSFSKGKSKERIVLSKVEIKLLYGVCQSKLERSVLSLFYGCGLRRGEAEKLNIRDVDFKGLWLYVRSGKGRKRRVIPLTKRIKADLANYYYEERARLISKETTGQHRLSFMLNIRGRRMRGDNYWNLFKKILERSGINKKVSLHHLRHSVATHLLAGGMSIEEVRDFLGHDFIETTQIYTRVNLSDHAL